MNFNEHQIRSGSADVQKSLISSESNKEVTGPLKNYPQVNNQGMIRTEPRNKQKFNVNGCFKHEFNQNSQTP